MKKIFLTVLTVLSLTTNVSGQALINDTTKTEIQLLNPYPYGYFKNFKSEVKSNKIAFNFGYVNTNDISIENIKLYFVIKNDVGETCGNGYLLGVGPIKGNYIARYNQEHEICPSYGDTNKIEITNVVLTYTNGTKKFLNKKTIKYN